MPTPSLPANLSSHLHPSTKYPFLKIATDLPVPLYSEPAVVEIREVTAEPTRSLVLVVCPLPGAAQRCACGNRDFLGPL